MKKLNFIDKLQHDSELIKLYSKGLITKKELEEKGVILKTPI